MVNFSAHALVDAVSTSIASNVILKLYSLEMEDPLHTYWQVYLLYQSTYLMAKLP